MTAAEKRALVKRLAEGKARARAMRPQRLAEVESRMRVLSDEHSAARVRRDYVRAAEIIRELEVVGIERTRLAWGDR